MSLDNISNKLGRAPNNLEQAFIDSILLSYKKTALFLKEISYLDLLNNLENQSILMFSGSKSNPNSDQKMLVEGYRPVIKLKFPQGNFILGRQTFGNNHNIIEQGDKILYFAKTGNYNDFIKKLHKNGLNPKIISLDPQSLGFTLINTAFTRGLGLNILINKHLQELLLNKKRGSLIIIKPDLAGKLLKISAEYRLDHVLAAELIKEKNIKMENNQSRLLNIPLDIFESLFETGSKFSMPHHIKTSAPAIQNTPDKNNYNDEVLFLLKSLKNNKNNSANQTKSKSAGRDAVWVLNEKSGMMGISVNDNFHLKYDDLQAKSMSYVANAARKLVCSGIKPQLCSNIIQYNQNQELSRLYLKGLKEMSQVLRLKIVDSAFDKNNSQTDGITAVAGLKQGLKLDSGFQSAGDFISILGSHRGELGGSLYLDKIQLSSAGNRPLVDLNMEPRIQDVVYSGIKNGLIQSARPVSAGGLVIAAAQVLAESREPLGARIFLSRKLRNDELLFAETQGMILLSISETDLMEFERICMSLGVPTTTIGRVTETGEFSFNDVVNLTVKDIKSNL